MTNHPMLGPFMPDEIGEALGSPYHKFRSPLGISGRATIIGDELELLAIAAKNPGTGQCRRFIATAKRNFRRIVILHVSNPMLADALHRYDFVKFARALPAGEFLTGLSWRQP